jgi:hypothetical protein
MTVCSFQFKLDPIATAGLGLGQWRRGELDVRRQNPVRVTTAIVGTEAS